MKHLGTIILAWMVMTASVHDLFGQAGTLDPSFGGTGIVTTDLWPVGSWGGDILIQNETKIIVGGYASNGANADFALVRYEMDGDIDTTFGTQGGVLTPIGSISDLGYGLALQPDNKILMVGTSLGIPSYIAVARYDVNGTLDGTFGVGGVVTTANSNGADAFAITVQPDGRIVIAGCVSNGADDDIVVVRYETNGALDAAFGAGGIVTTAIGSGNDRAFALTLQPDGKILVAGEVREGASSEMVVVRYESNGVLDSGFGTAGSTTTSFGSGFNLGYDLVLQPDGKILLAGNAWLGGDACFGILRYLPDGSLDPTFSGDGLALHTAYGFDVAQSIALQQDGRIIVTGTTWNGTDDAFCTMRLEPNGELDPTFATSGRVVSNIGTGDDNAMSTTLQNDGKILVTGYAWNGTANEIAIVRYLGDAGSFVHETGSWVRAMALSPNPVYEQVVLSFELSKREPLAADLVDALGQVVLHLFDRRSFEPGMHRSVFDLTELQPGCYILRLSNAGRTEEMQLVKR